MFAAVLASCSQAPNGLDPTRSSIIVTSPAHPALTYYGMVHGEGANSPGIWVMDADGSHQTPVQVGPPAGVQFGSPSWSPSGASICFTQGGMGVFPDTIKAFDVVTLNSAGAPVGSNLRTIFGTSDPSASLAQPCWSSTAAGGKIAFVQTGLTIRGQTTSTLCVVPQNGGKPVNVLTAKGPLELDFPTWSPDDSRLAVVRANLPTEAMIMIYNTSTWQCVDSIPLVGGVLGLEWSRAGMNTLAFGMRTVPNDPYFLYTCDPITGAAPVTDSVRCYWPTWAPDNSSVMYWQFGVGMLNSSPFKPITTVVSPYCNTVVKWKR